MEQGQTYSHRPVLLDECIEGLRIRPGGLYLDGTLGRAGHSREIARRLDTGRLVCIDRDQAALDAAQDRLAGCLDKVELIHGNFGDLAELLDGRGLGPFDGMLFDLGVSSPQLDDPERGFSYMHDAPLDMSFSGLKTAAINLIHNARQKEEARVALERLYAAAEALSAQMREKDVEADRLRFEMQGREAQANELESAIAVLKSSIQHNLENTARIREELERISIAVETLQLWSERMLATGAIDAERYEEYERRRAERD